MTIIPKPFEHPLQVGDMDCLVTVRIDTYYPAGGDDWHDPKHPAYVEFTLESIRVDSKGSKHTLLPSSVEALLAQGADFRTACLEAIEAANEPPED